MFVRKLLCAMTILALSLGIALADDVKGRITQISDKKVTVVTGKKGDTKTTEYDIAKDCKFCKKDKDNKVALEDGVKNEVFKDIDAKKGLPATLSVTDNKVTEIVLSGKKKNN